MLKKVAVESAAEAYLELLASRGVEYFFGNAGTDFAPIIEAYAKRAAAGPGAAAARSRSPHEIPAVGMAHGYAMVTGRPQVVMVHVIVGTANALGGIINAAALEHPHPVIGRPHADHRGRLRGQPQPPHPLGPGVVRPGRDGARVREVGLRASAWAASSRRWWTARWPSPSRSRRAPSTSPCRARCWPSSSTPSSTPTPRARCAPAATLPDPAAVERGGGDAGRRAQPDHHHQGARPRSGRGAGAGARWPRRSACRSSISSTPT